ISTSADTSQNEQIVNVPSSPDKPSSVSSTRYRSTRPSSVSSSAIASTVARTRGSSAGRNRVSMASSSEASNASSPYRWVSTPGEQTAVAQRSASSSSEH